MSFSLTDLARNLSKFGSVDDESVRGGGGGGRSDAWESDFPAPLCSW